MVGHTSLKMAENQGTMAAASQKEKAEKDEMESASGVGKAQARNGPAGHKSIDAC
jgi:hypothetical protein